MIVPDLRQLMGRRRFRSLPAVVVCGLLGCDSGGQSAAGFDAAGVVDDMGVSGKDADVDATSLADLGTVVDRAGMDVPAGSRDTSTIDVNDDAWLPCHGDDAPLPSHDVDPVDGPDMPSVTQIALGGELSCALTTDGEVRCWGSNLFGQIPAAGRELSVCRNVYLFRSLATVAPCVLSPASLVGIDHVTSLVVGYVHSCALREDRHLWCWGNNFYGQLGRPEGPYEERFTPDVAAGLDDVRAVTLGDTSTWVLNSPGLQVRVMGFLHHCIPAARPTDRSQPFHFAALDPTVQISPGNSNACALWPDGAVGCWGDNEMGSFGNGDWRCDPPGVDIPVRAHIPVPIAQLSSGGEANWHAALARDGHVWAWGLTVGCFEVSSTTCCAGIPCETTPRLVLGLDQVTQIVAGYHHQCALRRDGTVWCWGNNTFGELGGGSCGDNFAPAPVLGLRDVVSIASGVYHTCALTHGGEIWCWGKNDLGQLGDGTRINRNRPVRVLW